MGVWHTDINECEDGTDSCDENVNCTNIDGSYTCFCSSGYSGNGTFCYGQAHTTSIDYITHFCTYIQISMNVMSLVRCVTLMLHVPTLLGVLCACVRKATVATGLPALVSTLII